MWIKNIEVHCFKFGKTVTIRSRLVVDMLYTSVKMSVLVSRGATLYGDLLLTSLTFHLVSACDLPYALY